MSRTLPCAIGSSPGSAVESVTPARLPAGPANRPLSDRPKDLPVYGPEDPSNGCGERVEPTDDRLGVAREGGRIEDRVEVEAGCRLGEQLAEGDALVPGALGVLLDDPVGVVARAAALDERKQRPLREERAVGDVDVRAHPVLEHVEALHDADREVLAVVEQDRRDGQDHAREGGVGDATLAPARENRQTGLRETEK